VHTLALAIDQGERTAAAVELRSTLSQTEDRTSTDGEADDTVGVDLQALAW
jgi:hypothetical protein